MIHSKEGLERIRQSKLGKNNPNFGKPAWNKGIKMECLRGENNKQWKGNEVSYTGLHHWVTRELGKPIKCEYCETTEGKIEWANKSREYKRDLTDWLQLCKKCHIQYDCVTLRGWITKRLLAGKHKNDDFT